MAPADLLRELHRLLCHVRDLHSEIEDAPAQLQAHKNRVARAEEQFRNAQDGLKKLKANVLEKEGALKAVFQQIAKYERQRNEAQATKEYAALQHEIDHSKQQGAKLEEEILTMMGEIDEQTAKIPEFEKSLTKVRGEASRFESEEQERHTRLTGELDRTRGQLAELEQAIPNDIRPTYDRLVQTFGAEGLAAVHEKTCSSCYSTLTIQQMRQLEGGRFIQCQTCSRALYLKS